MRLIASLLFALVLSPSCPDLAGAQVVHDAELDLTLEQHETYQMAEEEGVLRLTEMNDAATIQHVFELILRLKQICNFDPATGASARALG